MQKNGSASIRNMPTCFAERSYPKRAFPETDIRFGESAFSVLFLRQPLQSGANIPFQQRGHAFGVTGKVRAQERLSGSRKAARAGCCKLGQPLNAPACSGRLFVCDVGKIPLQHLHYLLRARPLCVACQQDHAPHAHISTFIVQHCRKSIPKDTHRGRSFTFRLQRTQGCLCGVVVLPCQLFHLRCNLLMLHSEAFSFLFAVNTGIRSIFPKNGAAARSLSPVGPRIGRHIRSAPQAPPVSAHDC